MKKNFKSNNASPQNIVRREFFKKAGLVRGGKRIVQIHKTIKL